MSTPNQREIKKIALHCSDSPDTMDIGAKEIDLWHKERGFKCIGYHYVIRRNGDPEEGRPEWMVGAHVKGHNYDSLGICWVGRDKPSDDQWATLSTLVRSLRKKYSLPVTAVYGHRELAPLSGKTCPNIDMDAFRAMVTTRDDKQ